MYNFFSQIKRRKNFIFLFFFIFYLKKKNYSFKSCIRLMFYENFFLSRYFLCHLHCAFKKRRHFDVPGVRKKHRNLNNIKTG